MTIKIVYDWGERDTIVTYPNDNATDDHIKSYAAIIHPDWVFIVVDHENVFNRRYIMRT